MTKLPNSEQSYKGKVKTHKLYITCGRRGRYSMVVGCTTTYAINAYHH
jgi:hypothetical protein